MDFYDVLLAKKLGGGGGSATLIDKNISSNGTYNASDDSADGYKKVVASVPNTYVAGDEGKVVSNGALVSQSSETYDQNGTYDTTLKNSVTVNVSNPSTGTLPITANGTYDVTNYASADVNVSVVSNEDAMLDGSLSGAYTNSNVTYLRTGALQNTKITSASFQNVTNTGQNVFKGCTSLKSVSMPKMQTVQAYAFQDCTDLEFADLSLCTTIVAAGFVTCKKLQTVILRSSSVVSLGNVNAFQSTPLRGYDGLSGVVYVPSSLISSYQTASNWSSIYAEGHLTFSAIEGSIYE